MRALPADPWRLVRTVLTAPWRFARAVLEAGWHFVLRRWIRADLVDSDGIVLTDHGAITLGEIRGSGLVGRALDVFCMVVQMVFGLALVLMAGPFAVVCREMHTWHDRLVMAAFVVWSVPQGLHMVIMPISWRRWAHRHPDLARNRRT